MQSPLVVVVDPVKAQRERVSRVLSRSGYRVVLVRGVLEAFHALVRGETPSAAVVDLGLPERGAWSLVDHVRQIGSLQALPIVATAAEGTALPTVAPFDMFVPAHLVAQRLVPIVDALVGRGRLALG